MEYVIEWRDSLDMIEKMLHTERLQITTPFKPKFLADKQLFINLFMSTFEQQHKLTKVLYKLKNKKTKTNYK